MILLSRKDFPVPALPVKNTLLPSSTSLNTLFCSVVNTTALMTGLLVRTSAVIEAHSDPPFLKSFTPCTEIMHTKLYQVNYYYYLKKSLFKLKNKQI